MIYLVVITSIVVLLYLAAWASSERASLPIHYLPIDPARSIKIPATFKGTPVDAKQRFIFEEAPYYQNFLPLLRWLPIHLIKRLVTKNTVLPTNELNVAEIQKGNDCIVWLGHASYFVRLNGVNMLVDPHFHSIGPYRRLSKVPFNPSELDAIDFILITHDHEDHCNEKTLKELTTVNSAATILTGKNMEELIRSFGIKNKVIEALWYETYPINEIAITFVPSRHYSKRIFRPFNSTLWGGFVFEANTANLFISADSGYGTHYRDIGNLFHPQIAVLGTGAYKPEWFMQANHMSPLEAVHAFHDMNASLMIPSHFGTFQLSDESVDDVLFSLNELRKDNNILDVRIGKVYYISDLLIHDATNIKATDQEPEQYQPEYRRDVQGQQRSGSDQE